MHKNLCRIVSGPPGVLICDAGLVREQVLFVENCFPRVEPGPSCTFVMSVATKMLQDSTDHFHENYQNNFNFNNNSPLFYMYLEH